MNADEKFKIKFQEVLGIELNVLLSSVKICSECLCKVEEFFAFKKKILEKQVKCVYLIDETLNDVAVCPLSSVKVEYLPEPIDCNSNPFLERCPQTRTARKPVVTRIKAQTKRKELR